MLVSIVKQLARSTIVLSEVTVNLHYTCIYTVCGLFDHFANLTALAVQPVVWFGEPKPKRKRFSGP